MTNIRLRVLPRIPPELPDEVELRNNGTDIQWKLASESTWTDLIAVADISGTDGDDGDNGTIWYSDSSAPSDGNGADGDYFLNSSNGDVYIKAGGTWGSPEMNLIGPSGDVTGPGSSTDDNLASFNGTGGNVIQDSGYGVIDEDDMSSDSDAHVPTEQSVKAYADTKTTGPASSVDNEIPLFDSTTGKALKNSGTTLGNIVRRGFGTDMILSNDVTDATNDIVIAAGSVFSDAANPVLMTLGSNMTKRLDAGWAPGTGNGMRNSAAAITNGTYFVYAVSKDSGADTDVYCDASPNSATVLTALQAETGGADYTNIRIRGAILRESAAIVGFVQYPGGVFLRKAADGTKYNNPGTSSGNLRTLKVPVGVELEALVNITVFDDSIGSIRRILVTSPQQSDVAPTETRHTFVIAAENGDNSAGSVRDYFWTNTSGQIRTRLSAADADLDEIVGAEGWRMPLGDY